MLQKQAQIYAGILLMIMNRKGIEAKLIKATRGARHLTLVLRLADSTKIDQAKKLDEAVALAARNDRVMVQRSTGYLLYQFELTEKYHQEYTTKDLPSSRSVGLAESKRPIEFDVEDNPHTVVCGTTGAGKTETIKTIAFGLTKTYKPDQMAMVMMSSKRSFAEFENAQHLLEEPTNDPALIEQIMIYLEAELTRRMRRNIKDDKRIFVVADELPFILSIPEATRSLTNLAERGREFGMYLIGGIQVNSKTELPKIASQMLNRYVGKVRDARESNMMSGFPDMNAHKLTGKGDFLHVPGPEQVRFQVATVTPSAWNTIARGQANRVDLAMVEPVQVTLPEPPALGGRPRLDVDTVTLCDYVFNFLQGNRFGRVVAEKEYGLSRSAHELHVAEADKFIGRFCQLSCAKLQGEC